MYITHHIHIHLFKAHIFHNEKCGKNITCFPRNSEICTTVQKVTDETACQLRSKWSERTDTKKNKDLFCRGLVILKNGVLRTLGLNDKGWSPLNHMIIIWN